MVVSMAGHVTSLEHDGLPEACDQVLGCIMTVGGSAHLDLARLGLASEVQSLQQHFVAQIVAQNR